MSEESWGAPGFVGFGEIMLRLSPNGRELLLQSPRMSVSIAGAEANVMTALARLGHRTGMVSAVPDNALGEEARALVRRYGVDVSGIATAPGRMPLTFVTPGAGLRATDVIYDRTPSALQDFESEWPWARILAGYGRLHLSGITPALNARSSDAALAAAESAVAAGMSVSFDGNFRTQLWKERAGDAPAILRGLVANADILFGDTRDIAMLVGRSFAESEEGARDANRAAFEAFPRLRLIATCARRADDVETNALTARLNASAGETAVEHLVVPGIVDRIGSGDAFAAGVLHGLAQEGSLAHAARCGISLAALKHSLPGDASLFTSRDLEAFMRGGSDIRR